MMMKVSLLELAFPDQIRRIRQMRKTDRGLEALCLDFELLSAELEKPPTDSETNSPCLKDPIIESLDGLAEEIANNLSAAVQSEVAPIAISEAIPLIIQAHKKD